MSQGNISILLGPKGYLWNRILTMKITDTISYLNKLSLFILFVAFSGASSAAVIAKSDILLHIATQCIDSSKVGYCSSCTLPRVDTQCGQALECKKTNEVWELSSQYVAIRDIKMCGCNPTFIHGLALPRAVVTGVEDPNRREAIWQFAWNAGLDRIEERSLALVVNPKSERTQNQLHVHILRLNDDARQNFAEYETAIINNLHHVWGIAEKIALEKRLNDYGILVSRYSADQFIVVVSKNSPEALFTKWRCN